MAGVPAADAAPQRHGVCRLSPRSFGEVAEGSAVLTAVEVLVSWPGDAESANTGFWPLFVLVVDEEADPDGTAWLSAHLDGGRAGEPAVTGECSWSVAEPDGEALLGLSARTTVPAANDLQILVPAECFLGMSGIVAQGAAVAVATRRHARRLVTRTDDRQALGDVLPLGCRTSGRLADLADLLSRGGTGHWTRRSSR
jgi:hypothetical protein